jgi:hypothetical protein
VPEGNNAAGHGVADFIHSGADWRFNMIAALRIGKSLPSAPSLNHENDLNIPSKSASGTRQVNIGSVRSTGSVDNRSVESAVWRPIFVFRLIAAVNRRS